MMPIAKQTTPPDVEIEGLSADDFTSLLQTATEDTEDSEAALIHSSEVLQVPGSRRIHPTEEPTPRFADLTAFDASNHPKPARKKSASTSLIHRRLWLAGGMFCGAALLFAIGIGGGLLSLWLPAEADLQLSEVPARLPSSNSPSTSRRQLPWEAIAAPPVADNIPVTGAPVPGTPAVAIDLVASASPVVDPQVEPSSSPETASSMEVSSVDPTEASFALSAPPPSSANFGLQIGACRSDACVRTYRQLLDRHQITPPWQRIRTERNTDGEPLHRIRIAPLTRAMALRLKDQLVTKDSRFRQAYVIAL